MKSPWPLDTFSIYQHLPPGNTTIAGVRLRHGIERTQGSRHNASRLRGSLSLAVGGGPP